MAKRKFSKDEIRAYWVGVGISSSRGNDSIKLLNSSKPKIRNAIRKGYQADNVSDISKRFK